MGEWTKAGGWSPTSMAPAEGGNALSVLLSKLRHRLGAEWLGVDGDRAAVAAGDSSRARPGSKR